ATRARRKSCSVAAAAARPRRCASRARSKMRVSSGAAGKVASWWRGARDAAGWTLTWSFEGFLASRSEGMLRLGNSTASALRTVVAAVADRVVPPLCLACHRPLSTHDAICAGCWSDIEFIRPPLCDRLGIPLPFDVGAPMISAAAQADPPDYDRARA